MVTQIVRCRIGQHDLTLLRHDRPRLLIPVGGHPDLPAGGHEEDITTTTERDQIH